MAFILKPTPNTLRRPGITRSAVRVSAFDFTRVIAEIKCAPHRFRHFDPPAQRHLAHDFPYAVIYLNESERIWVLAVMPLRRAPGYWRERLS